jgi:hypothetical protein
VRRGEAVHQRRVRPRHAADALGHLRQLREEGRREDPAVVREEPDDDQVLVAEHAMHLVQGLDERMMLRQQLVGVDLDPQARRRPAERDRGERDGAEHEPAAPDDEAGVGGEQRRSGVGHGWGLLPGRPQRKPHARRLTNGTI